MPGEVNAFQAAADDFVQQGHSTEPLIDWSYYLHHQRDGVQYDHKHHDVVV